MSILNLGLGPSQRTLTLMLSITESGYDSPQPLPQPNPSPAAGGVPDLEGATMIPKRQNMTQIQRDCLHVVSTLGTKKNETIAGGWRYSCIKCGLLQKTLNGVLVSDDRAKEIIETWKGQEND